MPPAGWTCRRYDGRVCGSCSAIVATYVEMLEVFDDKGNSHGPFHPACVPDHVDGCDQDRSWRKKP